MKYKIKTINNKFCLYEINTDKIIYCSSNEINIKNLCKKLNSGSGFEGYTPDFFFLRAVI